MRRGWIWPWLLLGACGGPMYTYGQLVNRPGKPANCPVPLVHGMPTRPYEEVGVLAPKDIEDGSLAGGENSFLEEVRGLTCAGGGEAIVVERDGYGRYVRGIVIRYK